MYSIYRTDDVSAFKAITFFTKSYKLWKLQFHASKWNISKLTFLKCYLLFISLSKVITSLPPSLWSWTQLSPSQKIPPPITKFKPKILGVTILLSYSLFFMTIKNIFASDSHLYLEYIYFSAPSIVWMISIFDLLTLCLPSLLAHSSLSIQNPEWSLVSVNQIMLTLSLS